MFKKIAFSGLMLSMLALPLLAQQTTTPTSEAPAAGNNRGQRYQATDPATRAKRQTDRITQSLSLDEATSKKLYDINLARAQKAEEVMKGSDPSNTKAKAIREYNAEYKTKLQGILTPEQMAKVEEMQSQQQGRRRDGNDTN